MLPIVHEILSQENLNTVDLLSTTKTIKLKLPLFRDLENGGNRLEMSFRIKVVLNYSIRISLSPRASRSSRSVILVEDSCNTLLGFFECMNAIPEEVFRLSSPLVFVVFMRCG